jgi:formylglycine-generating enzyme required for sulfatase activity
MLPEKYQWIVQQFEPEGDPRLLFEVAARLEDEGNLEGAATVYDRAFGLDPADEEISTGRGRVLDELSVTEHGIHFRYVPGGSFLMGSLDGEEDERPWHPVWLSPFWMAETPVSWEAYCRLMDWEPPPRGMPTDWEAQRDADRERWMHFYYRGVKIRNQYCWENVAATTAPAEPGATSPRRYDTKPMTAVAWEAAAALGEHLSTPGIRYALPTEAQWEKAARGGLIGMPYAWGAEPPARDNCDFGRFHEFSILAMKAFAPNGYGLYAVCGGLWEWTRDWYDGAHYGHSPMTDPEGPSKGKERVARGGSWTDCAEAVTVTYRMSFAVGPWSRGEKGMRGDVTPNVGFRLCRMRARKV